MSERAFPDPARAWSPIDKDTGAQRARGMTLRDYFAAKAMQGLLSNSGGPIQANGISGWGLTNCADSDIAAVAYRIADAMLKARQS